MNPNQALWEKGDFTRIAASMRQSGEALVRQLGIAQGLKVLDLGCGDGTTALPAARLGADVLGVDIARNLVEAGNRRAQEHGLTNVRFQQGDATDLAELQNQAFDLVISIFGAMFAPKPFDVAKEMVRVTRPGGRIVMGNWIPNDPTLVAQILKISSAYSPPPPEGFVSPMTWGIEANVIERFASAGVPQDNLSVYQRHVYVQLSQLTIRPGRCVQALLRAHHECVRSRGSERARRRSAAGTGRPVRRPEPEQQQGRHLDPGNLPAGDRDAPLTR